MVWIWEAEVCWDWGQGPTAGPGSSWGHMGLGKGLKAHYFSLSHSDSKAWYLWCHSLDMGQDPCRVGPGSRGKKRSKRGKNLRVPERRKVWHSNTTSDFQKELTFHGFFRFFFLKKIYSIPFIYWKKLENSQEANEFVIYFIQVSFNS